ncbi:unnamed protein product [Cunninghamella blakesleeana]
MTQLQPQSTIELGQLAAFHVELNTPIRLYFRSADLLLKQARIYKKELDYEHAYILYMKYTNLGLTELPKHTNYKDPENKSARNKIRKVQEKKKDFTWHYFKQQQSNETFINAQYEEFIEKERSLEKQKQSEIAARHSQQLQFVINPTRYDPETDKQPVKLESEEEWNLQNALKDVIGVGNNEERVNDYKNTTTSGLNSLAQYPHTSFQNKSDGFTYQPHVDNQYKVTPGIHQPPQLPPKPSTPDIKQEQVPVLPPKIALEAQLHNHPHQIPSSPGPALPPKIKLEDTPIRPPSPEIHQPFSGVTTEKGEPLRTFIIPNSLQNKFLNIAKNNTDRNIETCGILAGTLKNNILKMTTLIIPKQTGTSDTCTTQNEEELFEFQDANDLLTFGWIHTHPSQSCFLSSVDLHTHCSYQLMLPEAIAIVCAPQHKPDFGIFRLTDPPGLDVISSCKIEKAFHPHPDVSIYTDTHNTSHVRKENYDIKVEDLRSR